MTRQFIAMLLLTCFGILIPTAASPARVCRLESTVYAGGFESFGITIGEDGSAKAKCCPECGEEGKKSDPCCVEIHKLPDSTEPPASYGLPQVLPVELKDYALGVERAIDHEVEVFSAAEPIRGPTDQGVRRALLSIWNI